MKVAIVLHLYYIDLWEEFRDKLKQIKGVDFDLYISLCVQNSDISHIIKTDFPDAKIFLLPNKGVDIGPFLIILDYMKSNNMLYDYLIKIHSKKSLYSTKHISVGENWRKLLVNSILGNSEYELHTTLLNMKDQRCTIAIPKQKLYIEPDISWMKELISSLGLKLNLEKKVFSAGTMFIVDHRKFNDFFNTIDILKLYDLTFAGYISGVNLIEHMLERLFCFIALNDSGKLYIIN